jgi:hypothetical protein
MQIAPLFKEAHTSRDMFNLHYKLIYYLSECSEILRMNEQLLRTASTLLISERQILCVCVLPNTSWPN